MERQASPAGEGHGLPMAVRDGGAAALPFRTIKVIDDPREAHVNNFTAANRLYETTGRPFSDGDFMRSRGKYSYSAQRSLFIRGQTLPCRLKGWTPFRTSD